MTISLCIFSILIPYFYDLILYHRHKNIRPQWKDWNRFVTIPYIFSIDANLIAHKPNFDFMVIAENNLLQKRMLHLQNILKLIKAQLRFKTSMKQLIILHWLHVFRTQELIWKWFSFISNLVTICRGDSVFYCVQSRRSLGSDAGLENI